MAVVHILGEGQAETHGQTIQRLVEEEKSAGAQGDLLSSPEDSAYGSRERKIAYRLPGPAGKTG